MGALKVRAGYQEGKPIGKTMTQVSLGLFGGQFTSNHLFEDARSMREFTSGILNLAGRLQPSLNSGASAELAQAEEVARRWLLPTAKARR